MMVEPTLKPGGFVGRFQTFRLAVIARLFCKFQIPN